MALINFSSEDLAATVETTDSSGISGINMEETLRRLVECPVCMEMRRDHRVYLCLNGHHICSVCRPKVERCPQGQCRYPTVSMRNRAVEAILATLPLSFACFYSPKCPFRAQRDKLDRHETVCAFRSITCPFGGCNKSVALNHVIDHVKERHPKCKVESTGQFERHSANVMWRFDRRPTNRPWNIRADSRGQAHFFLCGYTYKSQVYMWISMLADTEEADQFSSRISLEHNGNRMVFRSPVYSVDMVKEKIWEDRDCAVINERCLREFLTDEGIDEDNKRRGYCRCFNVTYELVDKNKKTVVQKAEESETAETVEGKELIETNLDDTSDTNLYTEIPHWV